VSSCAVALTALGRVLDCHDGGGLVGIRPTGEIVANFRDTQTSGLTQGAGEQGLTAARMRTAATFLNTD
jgi:hypothetical protein